MNIEQAHAEMKPLSRWRWMCRVVMCGWLFGGLWACGTDASTEPIVPSQQWLCSEDGHELSCVAALPALPGDQGAYACESNEPRVICPSGIGVRNAHLDIEARVREALDPSLGTGPLERVRRMLDEQPWACLLTGDHQRTCLKDIGPVAALLVLYETEMPAGDGLSPKPEIPGVDFDPAGKLPTGIGGSMNLPGDCLPRSWETFFCGHATEAYRQHGVEIEFPCEIFDAAASFQDVVTDSPFLLAAGTTPSCFLGEQTMRSGAWLAAVGAGCRDLHKEILVMCQQAANYAPKMQACRPTGTW